MKRLPNWSSPSSSCRFHLFRLPFESSKSKPDEESYAEYELPAYFTISFAQNSSSDENEQMTRYDTPSRKGCFRGLFIV